MNLGSLGLWLTCLSLVLMYFAYDGYGRALQLIRMLRRTGSIGAAAVASAVPAVSVIIPVFNEAGRIKAKLDNLLGQDFARDGLEVVVVSDGSDDATESIVSGYGHGVKLLRTLGRLGKSLAQNQAVASCRGDILVLTDAAVVMDPGCLKQLVAPFADSRVGCVTAEVVFGTKNSVTGADQNTHWNYELKLRRLESELGWLATAAGPAMAIRRSLWRDLPAEYGDDCVLPLDVALQGRLVVHARSALARDESFATARQEYRARVRMTVRNWTGTFSRRALLNPLRFPGYAFALWSHKILRWLSPFLIIVMAVGAFLIAIDGDAQWPLAAVLAGFVAGIAGVIGLYRGVRIPVLATAGSFLLANTAFLVGLLTVMRRGSIKIYNNQ